MHVILHTDKINNQKYDHDMTFIDDLFGKTDEEKKKEREHYGQYIPNEQSVQTSSSTKGSVDIINEVIKTEKTNDDETLIDLKVGNPLHKITQLLSDIKKHQSTTISLRFTIPLIALPIIMLAAFQLGRAQTTCSQLYTTKIGVIKNFTVMVPRNEPSLLERLISFFPSVLKPESAINLVPDSRAILITGGSGDITTIVPSSTIDINSYDNKSVILTGKYSACNQAITLDAPQNISFN